MSLGELADDLAEVFDTDREQVVADLLELTRTLADTGLLEPAERDSPDLN